jgi:hypothetical protein
MQQSRVGLTLDRVRIALPGVQITLPGVRMQLEHVRMQLSGAPITLRGQRMQPDPGRITSSPRGGRCIRCRSCCIGSGGSRIQGGSRCIAS